MRTILALLMAASCVHPAAAQVVRTAVTAPQGVSVGAPLLPAQNLAGPSSLSTDVSLSQGSALPSVSLLSAEVSRPGASAAAAPLKTESMRASALPPARTAAAPVRKAALSVQTPVLPRAQAPKSRAVSSLRCHRSPRRLESDVTALW